MIENMLCLRLAINRTLWTIERGSLQNEMDDTHRIVRTDNSFVININSELLINNWTWQCNCAPQRKLGYLYFLNDLWNDGRETSSRTISNAILSQRTGNV